MSDLPPDLEGLISGLPPEQQAAARQLLLAQQGTDSGANQTAQLWGMNQWADAAVNERGMIPAKTKLTPKRFGRPSIKTTPAHQGVIQTSAIKMMNRIMEFNPQQIAELQAKLFAGGFYARSVKPEDIVPGVKDNFTLEAWQQLVLKSAQYTAAGSNATLDDVLNEMAETGIGISMAADSGGGGGASYQPTQLTDPASLRQMAKQVSKSLLGRELTDEEEAKIVAEIHGGESDYASAIRGQSATLVSPNPQARIMEHIEKNMNPEFEATRVAQTYDIFRSIIGGSRG